MRCTLLCVLEGLQVKSVPPECGVRAECGVEGEPRGAEGGFTTVRDSLNFVQSATVSNGRKDFNQAGRHVTYT